MHSSFALSLIADLLLLCSFHLSIVAVFLPISSSMAVRRTLQFPLSFQSLYAHPISFVKHFTWPHILFETTCRGAYELHVCGKRFLEGTFMCAPSFRVRARLTACV